MEMRRKDRARGEAFSLELIDRCSHGVMALQTGEDTPYCLPPVSYTPLPVHHDLRYS